MRFYVGSDHGGVELRQLLCAELVESGHEVVEEYGPEQSDEKADYPDVGHQVARAILDDEGSFGLLVCGTGQGMAMAANAVPGVRAGVVVDPFSARMIRAHNNAQVLCLGQRVVGTELAKLLLHEFLNTEFEGGRHAGRVAKIEAS